MKQTNYHLFDFMDFDLDLKKEETLWKAYSPTRIEERNGDIVVTIPYQKQQHQEDIEHIEGTAAGALFDLVSSLDNGFSGYACHVIPSFLRTGCCRPACR